MKSVMRILAMVLFVSSLVVVASMSRNGAHKINRQADGSYEFVYYVVLGWRLSATAYYSLAVTASLVIAAGTLILWRMWRPQKRTPKLTLQ